MKQLFTFILLCSALCSEGQKLRFTNKTNQWITSGYFSSDGCTFVRRMQFGGDVVLSGLTYTNLNEVNTIIGNPWNQLSCNFGFHYTTNYYVREDTIANKVYYRAPSVDTEEHVLYDYNLQVGDTIQYKVGTLIYRDSVVQIDSILVNGIYHKIFKFDDHYTYPHRFYTVIEGIGATPNPMLPAYFDYCFEYSEQLHCFTEDGLHPSINIEARFCGTGGSEDTFYNQGNCTHLAVNNINDKRERIVMSPNPANEHIAVTVYNKQYGRYEAQVSDVTGRRVAQGESIAGENIIDIDTRNLYEGLYIVYLSNEEGVYYTNKLVVKH